MLFGGHSKGKPQLGKLNPSPPPGCERGAARTDSALATCVQLPLLSHMPACPVTWLVRVAGQGNLICNAVWGTGWWRSQVKVLHGAKSRWAPVESKQHKWMEGRQVVCQEVELGCHVACHPPWLWLCFYPVLNTEFLKKSK